MSSLGPDRSVDNAALGPTLVIGVGRIERKHSILEGFTDTDWLPGAQWLQPVAPFAEPVMTVIPPFANYPPELAYPYAEETDILDLIAKEQGGSRVVYLATDFE